MKQKKSTVTSAIGKLSVSFLALSSKHPSVGNYPVQLNLQKSQRFLRQKAISYNVIPLSFTSHWGLTACHDLQAHFFARWAEYYHSFCFIILDENIPSSSGHYINSVKKKMNSFSRISNDPFQDIRGWMYLFSITFPVIVKSKY